MAIKKNIIKYNDPKYEVIDKEYGYLKESENEDLISRTITVTELFEEPESEDDEEVLFMKDITYIRNFRGNGVLFRQRLTPQETQLAMFLQDFVCYDDCILRTNGNKKGNPLTVDDLRNLYGGGLKDEILKEDTFRKQMASLRKKEVLAYHNSGTSMSNGKPNPMKCITLNPYIVCRGMKVEKWISDYFSQSMWANDERQKKSKYKIEK